MRSPTAAGWFGPCVLARMLGQCVADEPHGNREGAAWRTARFDWLQHRTVIGCRSHGSAGSADRCDRGAVGRRERHDHPRAAALGKHAAAPLRAGRARRRCVRLCFALAKTSDSLAQATQRRSATAGLGTELACTRRYAWVEGKGDVEYDEWSLSSNFPRKTFSNRSVSSLG